MFTSNLVIRVLIESSVDCKEPSVATFDVDNVAFMDVILLAFSLSALSSSAVLSLYMAYLRSASACRYRRSSGKSSHT